MRILMCIFSIHLYHRCVCRIVPDIGAWICLCCCIGRLFVVVYICSQKICTSSRRDAAVICCQTYFHGSVFEFLGFYIIFQIIFPVIGPCYIRFCQSLWNIKFIGDSGYAVQIFTVRICDRFQINDHSFSGIFFQIDLFCIRTIFLLLRCDQLADCFFFAKFTVVIIYTDVCLITFASFF